MEEPPVLDRRRILRIEPFPIVAMDWTSPRATSLIERALREDYALADATTLLTIDADQMAQAEIRAKQDCILAGLGLIPRVFQIFAGMALKTGSAERMPPVVVTSHPEVFDGVRLHTGQTVAVLRGPARQLLSCERVTLNFLQRLSGIATLTRTFVDEVRGTGVRILDTRKTAPGLRLFDKYAVTCGGGMNHRSDLSDAILIKNNHIRLAGGITAVLQRAHAQRRPEQPIEIEARTMAELDEVLRLGADRVLLDNMTPEQIREAVAKVAGRAPLEISGGIQLGNVRVYAETGAQFISVGALTHSVPAVDLSMKIVPVGGGRQTV